ncbi:hypothetical protein A3A84_02785 [Candidatus Collierbacteria bacterium RIFCSPLOWO2_01_FULL_50_23]|uniref:Cell envelope-related transcriptional attenuator domain-containing protein n=2 Tax=Candidatus Collieribacteriota TaxID=1752725 RepID=A0A1F5EY61_9BACT|nr:MAG: hypothetical protein A2703_01220 [Candidatus Collierbacteria bacterium RIFCSPHIGHO2_01_FULL_50_25]OGD72307.1 MAG: hypothetical protein A3D09_01865 [Candidatus Collierbacteria bacterium RIFCSPHIGHO2_02_FULL_49_10]OGD74992.1 MAG: hypothetical protein A3A84_02785 [Candidatus Collierbacteria bacterium RIFCSPLOWO2_01_FULL_50_23]
MNSKLIRLRRSLFGLTSFLLHHLGLIIVAVLVFVLTFVGLKAKDVVRQAGLGQVNLFTFLKSPQSVLESTNGRTNFLVLGVRGEGSDSPDLTDTMIIASYSYANKNLTLVSIPRDLWVSSLKTKINSVYHYGNFREPNGGGIKLAQSAILETLGLPIHHTAVIDFSLFRDAIDLVDGVDINVATGFTDNQFPIEGRENSLPITSRYETLTFAAGANHMDGTTALKFVRSRRAEGDEGTDIARDRRQQQVVAALKQKLLAPGFIVNRNKLVTFYKISRDHLDTNIDEKVYPSLVRLAFDSYRQSIKKIVLSYTPDENGVAILENPPATSTYLNQWVLIAKDNNWPALQQYLTNKLENK